MEGIEYSIPHNLPVGFKVWLSRLMLQTVWRWRRCQAHTLAISFSDAGPLCGRLVANRTLVPTIFKTNTILALATFLELIINVHDLYTLDTECVVYPPSL